MTPPPSASSSLVDVDASIVFRRPLLIVVIMTFVVGVLDGIGYRHLGVFTANQAGNMVVGTTLLVQQPAVAVLALTSLVGCGLGVASIVVARHVRPWLAGPSGSRALLVAAAILIFSASVVGERLAPGSRAGSAATGALWSATWWASAASVALAAFSVAMLGMVFISGGGVRAPVLASTNAFVDAVRYGVASRLDDRDPSWPTKARRAAAFPIAWSLGAATAAAGVGPPTRLGLAGAAAVVVILVALFARRVTAAGPPPRPTV